jgi:hypothetical protein
MVQQKKSCYYVYREKKTSDPTDLIKFSEECDVGEGGKEVVGDASGEGWVGMVTASV